MKKLLLAGIGIMLAGSVWAASGDQPVKLNSVNSAATVTVKIEGTVPVQATDLDIRNLSSAQDTVGAVQSGTWVIATVTAIATDVTVQATDLDIRNLSSAQDSISAVQSGNWTVAISGTPSIRYLSATTDNIGVYGNYSGSQVQVKVDSTGQIYAITAPESGDNIKKTYVFSNIATGSWVEVGSYTVSAGKNLKIYNSKVTGRHALDFKISNGTAAQDIRMATSPSYGEGSNVDSRPIANAAATVIRCYVQAETATNDGTVSFNGFEY